ncbi:hypothetical protein BW733_10445 [Tessaracoccus flavescens]|uniref:HTH luxR-type domain-containing protein n=2 Tax=Tessaracoccus flavescens TaxID=399497 RepID=A0A1Q2CYL9_9ACTN|nr:hypothetical protein BW733_10445 [Tessaracoccus flavescens]
MGLSEGSVKQYLSHVGDKLGVTSRTQILIRAIQLRLVDPPALSPLRRAADGSRAYRVANRLRPVAGNGPGDASCIYRVKWVGGALNGEYPGSNEVELGRLNFTNGS